MVAFIHGYYSLETEVLEKLNMLKGCLNLTIEYQPLFSALMFFNITKY